MSFPIETFANDESGATAVEYSLIASLMAMVVVLGVTVLGVKLGNTFAAAAGFAAFDLLALVAG